MALRLRAGVNALSVGRVRLDLLFPLFLSSPAAAAAMGDGRVGGGTNRPAWLQQYELVGKIGEGTYGLVFLARLKQSHPHAAAGVGRRGSPIAIKKFKQSKEGDGVSPTAIREIMVPSSGRSAFPTPPCHTKP